MTKRQIRPHLRKRRKAVIEKTSSDDERRKRKISRKDFGGKKGRKERSVA